MISSINSAPIWGEANQWDWNGINCHWRVLGERNGRPILLLHGFGASSDHWRNNAHALEKEGFRIYSLDLIGFGKSEQPGPKKIKKLDNLFWSEQVASFIKEIISKENKGKTILIGNSLGSLVALTTSVFHPSLISAVVAAPLPDPALMKTFELQLPKCLKKIQSFFIKLFFKLIPLGLFIKLIIKTKLIYIGIQFAYFCSIKSDRELMNIIKKPAQRKSAARALRAMCIGMTTRSDFYTAPFLLDKLERVVNRPSFLMVWGKEDRLVPLIIGKKLISRYHWLDLFILENTGHCPHDESPSEFNQYVLNWLRLNS